MNWKRNPHPVRTLLALGLAGLLSVLGSRMAHAASRPVQSHSPPAAGATATGDAATRVLATLVAVAARPTAATPAYRADVPGTQIFLPLVQDFVFTSHRDAYQTYEGAVTCLRCHEDQARQVHGSVHYQWFGPTPDVPWRRADD